MSVVIIVAIVFGSIVALAGLLCGTIIFVIRMRHAGIYGSEKKASKDEAMMIQDIYRGLEKMENRIEALETILMDSSERKGSNSE